jgi:PAS domain S-box-containing protein
MDVVDWAATPVGPQESWPGSLRTALDIMTGSRFPMVVIWGPEFTLFYNSSYAPMLGSKHPWAMGRSLREVWPEIWETIGPMLQSVLQTGVPTYNEDMLLPLMRNGYLEECYFTFSFSAVTNDGQVCGIFCAVTEASAKIIAQRRLRTLYALSSRSLHDVAQANPIDLPFSRIYLRDETGRFVLSESSGAAPAADESWPLDEVTQTGRMQVVPSTIDAGSMLVYTTRVASAAIFPLIGSSQVPMGAMVIGLSPYSFFDESYQTFLNLLTTRIAGDINGERTDRARTIAAGEIEGARDVAVRNERVLRMLADAVPQIICTAGSDGKVDYFNRRWFEHTGMSLTQTFEDAGWLKAFHPEDRAAIEEAWRTVAGGTNDFSAEARIRSADGEYTWFLHRGVALRTADGALARLFVTATDINERKLGEERERFLAHASDVLSSTLDVPTILQRITELCVPQFADWCQLQSLSAEGELVVEAVRHKDPELNRRLEALVGRTVVAVRDATFGSPLVLRQARSKVLDHNAALRAVWENVPDAHDRAIYDEAGLGTALIVPLIVRGHTRGTLHLVTMDHASAMPKITVGIAEELARRAALAIDNSRLYEREHRVATALQHAMLPARLPTHARLELSYAYRPAERESRVGGDWYDAFAISPDELALSIGDVAGHGLEASVAMNEARQALRLSALEGLSPAETLRRANAALMINDGHPMITAIYGIVDVARATFRYSSAGHPHAALAPFSGNAHYLEGGGIPMGVDKDAQFPEREVRLSPYSTLLLYTDGLIEFDRNIERESARLLEALCCRVQDTGADGAAALVRHVLNNRQYDDIAVLAATYLPPQPGTVELRLPAEPTSATIARRFVSRYARVAQLEPERTFDLVLAVGEAVANAVEHAYRGATGDFVLRLDARDDKIFGEVQDLGTWYDRRPPTERGRGLAILRATTQRLELNRSERGTTVAFAV